MTHPTTAALEVVDLVKTYYVGSAANTVVNGVDFQIEEGNFYSLLGPSGCGKTTTLRCTAGLEHADGGSISLAGEVVSGRGQHIAIDKRDFGMVFQSYAVWPHMTVFENVAFPLRVGSEKVSRKEIASRVDEALALVRLEDFPSRSATTLSGGQQQRLALARALVRRPKLLLLDEPLSNLDAKLRDQMRAELREIQRRLGLTTLYVTHDQGEALSMSNRVAVMNGGRIEQEGTPRDIYQRPTTRFVADFVGRANFIDAVVVETEPGGLAHLSALGSTICVRCPQGVKHGDAVALSIRPENLRLHLSADADRPNLLEGVVRRAEFLGDFVELLVEVGGSLLSVKQAPVDAPRSGQTIYLEFNQETCTVLSDDHGVAVGNDVSAPEAPAADQP